MTGDEYLARIRKMKEYLKRWYIINKLYHLEKHRRQPFVEEKDLLFWILGADIHKAIQSEGYKQMVRPGLKWLFGDPAWSSDQQLSGEAATEIRRIIEDCKDEYIGYIRPVNGRLVGKYWDLTARGRESYTVSHLVFNKFFGNAYVKGIILGALALFVAYYINNYILHISTAK